MNAMFAAALGSLLMAAAANEKHPVAGTETSPDAILSTIHTTNQLEIEFGELARQKAGSDRVRTYGARLTSDHSDADMKVRRLAESKGLSIDRPPSSEAEQRHLSEQKATLEKLKTLDGSAFDSAFLAAMAEGHAETVRSLEERSANLQDKDVKQLVDDLIPVLEKHRATATTTQAD
jgi:putative membrane protein